MSEPLFKPIAKNTFKTAPSSRHIEKRDINQPYGDTESKLIERGTYKGPGLPFISQIYSFRAEMREQASKAVRATTNERAKRPECVNTVRKPNLGQSS